MNESRPAQLGLRRCTRLTKGFSESLYYQVVVVGCTDGELQTESHPKFHNEVVVPIVRIGCREFDASGWG